MIAKRLISLIAPADTQRQCTRDPGCHRIDKHDGACKSLGVVLVEKAEAWIKEKLS